jgi:multimeric flavodoxin WrbA
MKIVAVSGSPRANGNTAYLTDVALEEAGKLGIETRKIVVTQYKISPCLGHDECWDYASCPQKDDTEMLVRQLYDADGVIFASPVYYYGVTAQLKAFMDRNVFYRRHKQRMKATCAGIIVVARAGGIEDTANNLARFISLNSNLKPEEVLQVTGIAKDAGEIKSNTAAIEQARKLGKDLARKLSAK